MAMVQLSVLALKIQIAQRYSRNIGEFVRVIANRTDAQKVAAERDIPAREFRGALIIPGT